VPQKTYRPGGNVRVRVKRCGKSAPPFQQWSGQGKPHTEQDQIGRKPGSERKLRLDACRLGAPNLRVGRLSRAVMRGPEEWPSCWSNPADRIRLTGPAAFIKTVVGRWQDRSSAKIAESVEKNVWDFIPGPGTTVWPSTKDQRPTTHLIQNLNWRKPCPHLVAVRRFAAAVLARKKS